MNRQLTSLWADLNECITCSGELYVALDLEGEAANDLEIFLFKHGLIGYTA